MLLKDLLLDVLAEAEWGGAAVIPPGTQAVIGRARQLPRHQQLHVSGAVGHQKLVGFGLNEETPWSFSHFQAISSFTPV